MKDALKELSREQIEFICKECNITEESLMRMDDDELYDSVYDIMCDIEIAELSSDDEPESERCEMASDIVTVLGNALAEEEGFYDQQEEDNEEDDYGKA